MKSKRGYREQKSKTSTGNWLKRYFKKRTCKEPVLLIDPHVNLEGECISENGEPYKCKYSTHYIGKEWKSVVCPIHKKLDSSIYTKIKK